LIKFNLKCTYGNISFKLFLTVQINEYLNVDNFPIKQDVDYLILLINNLTGL